MAADRSKFDELMGRYNKGEIGLVEVNQFLIWESVQVLNDICQEVKLLRQEIKASNRRQ